MDTSAPTPQKNGLGALGWIGIGCGGLFLLCIVGAIVAYMFFAPAVKQFVEDAEKNPARATAMIAVKASAGELEVVAEDDANKRYTLKEKKTGKLTTIYWNEKTKKPETIQGDFSAIPPAANPAEQPPAIEPPK